MKRTIIAMAVGAAVLALVPHQADAQASITATATVATALTVNAGNDLDFQLVIPGFTKTVLVTDATAGTFDLTGGAGAEVALTFTALPATLDDGSGNVLPITYAGVHNTVNDPVAGATGFAPTAGAGPTTNLAGSGELFVFLGGVVDAGASPPTGTYTGMVTLDAAYTGN